MTRCRSWRYIGAASENPSQLPVGRDRRSWRPCRNRIDRGVRRCRECEDSLVTCPNTAVRRALAVEEPQTDHVLRALESDPSPVVSSVAVSRLSSAPAAGVRAQELVSVWG